MNRAVLISCPSHLSATLVANAAAISASERTAAEQGADVGLVEGEEAVAELAVGGQADPVAASAEGPADRGDHADAAAAVEEVVIDGRGPRVLVGGRGERTDPGGRAGRGSRPRRAPCSRSQRSRGIQRHVLDEPELEAMLARELGQRDHVLLGHSAERDGVDLDGVEPRRLGGVDARDDLFEAGAPGQLLEPPAGPSCRG